MDQISYDIINQTPSEFQVHLLNIFNQIFSEGSFPDTWKDSLVVLIPKPGSNGVRPISLMSCACKLMERILYRRLSWFIESRPILPQAQSGFRPFRACNDNLATLVTSVKTGFLNHAVTVAVFLDIAGAFDKWIRTSCLRTCVL